MKTQGLLVCILVLSIAAAGQSASKTVDGRSQVNYTITDLGTGTAVAINDSGLVTGYSTSGRAFIVRGADSRHDIGVLGGSGAVPRAVDNAGRVTGISYIQNNLAYHAFLYEHDKMHDLGTLGGNSSDGQAINSSGWVTGASEFTQSNGNVHAFLHTGKGPLQDLGTLGGPQSVGVAINNKGDVVGFSDTSDFRRAAFLYRNGVMQNIGGGEYGEARGINQAGWVTGVANRHAFLYRGTGPLMDLGTLGGDSSTGVVISDSGLVAGSSDTANREAHAFLFSGAGPLTDLGTLGAGYSWPRAVNNYGQVVGVSAVKNSTVYHSFLYSDGLMYDLAAFAPGWEVLDVVGINDRGQIIGSGLINGTSHAFRLDPLPN